MTEPPYGGSEFGAPPPPPPGYPPPAGQYPGAYVDPAAPYGRHPLTGEPLSDKSRTVAGLLQLLGLIGILGVGRIYMGQVTFGIVQLIVGLVTCGIAAVIWGIIDCVILMTGQHRDQYGRPLRDGA